MPFDLYCPSMQENVNELEAESEDESEVDEESSHELSCEEAMPEESSSNENDGEIMPVFRNIFDVLASPFIEEQ